MRRYRKSRGYGRRSSSRFGSRYRRSSRRRRSRKRRSSRGYTVPRGGIRL